MLVMLFGLLSWLLSIAAALWYLRKVSEMHQEMQSMRRYLQAIYEHLNQR